MKTGCFIQRQMLPGSFWSTVLDFLWCSKEGNWLQRCWSTASPPLMTAALFLLAVIPFNFLLDFEPRLFCWTDLYAFECKRRNRHCGVCTRCIRLTSSRTFSQLLDSINLRSSSRCSSRLGGKLFVVHNCRKIERRSGYEIIAVTAVIPSRILQWCRLSAIRKRLLIILEHTHIYTISIWMHHSWVFSCRSLTCTRAPMKNIWNHNCFC